MRSGEGVPMSLIKKEETMARKEFYFENAGRVDTDHLESNVTVNMNMIDFVKALEFKYELVGVYFEKYKVGFLMREKV